VPKRSSVLLALGYCGPMGHASGRVGLHPDSRVRCLDGRVKPRPRRNESMGHSFRDLVLRYRSPMQDYLCLRLGRPGGQDHFNGDRDHSLPHPSPLRGTARSHASSLVTTIGCNVPYLHFIFGRFARASWSRFCKKFTARAEIKQTV